MSFTLIGLLYLASQDPIHFTVQSFPTEAACKAFRESKDFKVRWQSIEQELLAKREYTVKFQCIKTEGI